uniref:NADH-ubiquinone oxidoreductase chain 6 n=1 Tax=Leucrocuta aphrodite TaxID=197168 RepID=A0A8F6U6F1_9INSE|nr:NADH dehydrogenase subunit 6 [Leucrocuta aphrodite]
MLMFSTLIVGFTFMTMNHPLAMGLVLLCQTLLVALFTGILAPSFWFSYILFLVFLGGMLVLFIYVTSLASNEMFSISSKSLMLIMAAAGLLIFFCLINDPLSWATPEFPDQAVSSQACNPSNLANILVKLYSSPSYFLTLLLVSYLFLTLVAVVTITQIFEGPLRSKH